MTITRTFHPVGQGAFYSETHEGVDSVFNVVFDCGTSESTGKMAQVVTNAFATKTIDILFISHFDKDHVSLLPYLKASYRIKKVVLPFLHKDERIMLFGYYCACNNERDEDPSFTQLQRDLILRPESFFEGSNIDFVRQINDDNRVVAQPNDVVVGPRSRIIDSATESFVDNQGGQQPYWCFVPYNYNSVGRWPKIQRKLYAWLASKGKTLDDMSDPDFVIKNRGALKSNVYGYGTVINENSMLVYSGPCKGAISSCCRFHEAGCVYAGDSDFNKVNISHVFSLYWNNVGTVQIPHHGALSSFDSAFLNSRHLNCPISVGAGGVRFGHPSQCVINQINSSGSKYWLVTDDPTSVYTQRYCYTQVRCCIC